MKITMTFVGWGMIFLGALLLMMLGILAAVNTVTAQPTMGCEGSYVHPTGKIVIEDPDTLGTVTHYGVFVSVDGEFDFDVPNFTTGREAPEIVVSDLGVEPGVYCVVVVSKDDIRNSSAPSNVLRFTLVPEGVPILDPPVIELRGDQ
jgi:hypothetical protein